MFIHSYIPDPVSRYEAAAASNQTTRDVAAANNVTKLDEMRLKRETGSGL